MKKRSRTYAVISSYILKIFLFYLITANSIPSKAEDFRITGIKLLNNSIFSQEEIDEIAKDYLNRALDFDDIL
jgi:hypothetical protein